MLKWKVLLSCLSTKAPAMEAFASQLCFALSSLWEEAMAHEKALSKKPEPSRITCFGAGEADGLELMSDAELIAYIGSALDEFTGEVDICLATDKAQAMGLPMQNTCITVEEVAVAANPVVNVSKACFVLH